MKYYEVNGYDNDSYFYYRNKKVLKYCEKCELIINREEAILNSTNTYKIKKKKYNYSHCYDGPNIVSDNFVTIYNKYKLKGLKFIKLPESPSFYLIELENTVKYDFFQNPDIYLKNKCKSCNQWYEISKIYPIRIIKDDEKKLGHNTFYKTDLESGEKIDRASIVLVTDDIPEIFKTEKIKDFYFTEC